MNFLTSWQLLPYDSKLLSYDSKINILVANWGIPLAAIADMKKDPEYISGKMTTGIKTATANILTVIDIN